ncbi:MAG: ABC transporter substrate-binding protein [Actinobacteria bacterium]|nr:ABC transporter substrate-binding protein [Actinomycetota bacterium]
MKRKTRNLKALSGIIIIAVLVLTMLFLSVFSGCGKVTSTTSSETKPIEMKKITVILDWVPNTNHTGIYAAKANGYYAKEGLNVDIIQPTEGGSADLIAAGKGEFGISYQEQVTYARTADTPLPVAAIAAIIQHNTSGFASPVEKNIKTPKDFEGKKYGGFGTPIEDAFLKALMKKYGADFSKLEIINIGASDFFTSVTRDVDFSWIYYGWDGVAAELRNFKINFMLLQDLDPLLDFYTPVIMASEKTINENPELVKKFLRATSQGYEFAISNPEKAAEILTGMVPELDKNIVAASQKYLAKQYKSDAKRWGEMKESVWETFGNWMYDNNLITKKLEASKAFNNEFLP